MRILKIIRSKNNFLDENIIKSQNFKKKKIFYTLLLVFIIGLMYGSILLQSKSDSIFEVFDIIQTTSTQNKMTSSFLKIVMSSFSSSFLFLIIIFLSGFSAIGQPVPYIVIFAKGLVLGSSISYFYLTYSIKGLLYISIIIFPVTLLIFFSLILSAKEAIKLSTLLFKVFLGNNLISIKTIKLYIFKNIIIVVFILASAILDGILSSLMAGLFSLK